MSYDARQHPSSEAEKIPDEKFSWDDPHGFHPHEHDPDNPHSAEEHHVSGWQLNVAVLAALLFFTLLTVFVAKGEVLLTTYTDIPITQLWNVIIAMAIATVKAMLVMMYFMHLRHDKALNTMVMLFTFATLGMFMTMPALDIGNREAVKGYGLDEVIEGGSGVGMARPNGDPIAGSIVEVSRQNKIAEVGPEKYWKKFYEYKLHYKHKTPERHPSDENNIHAKWIAAGGAHHHDDHDAEHASAHNAGDAAGHTAADEQHTPFGLPTTSTANRQVVRTGLTPGLFSAAAGNPPAYQMDHGGHDHPELDHDTPDSDSESNAERDFLEDYTGAPGDGNTVDTDDDPASASDRMTNPEQ